MLRIHLNPTGYKNYKKNVHLFKTDGGSSRARFRTGIIVAAMAFIGFIGVHGIKAATYYTFNEAESGIISGNAALTGDPGAAGSNSVAFGEGTAPTAPSALKTITGGTSIAVRWTGSSVTGGTIKQYNIIRNGTQVGTVTPGFHANFPEKNGNGYIDSAVTKGATYSYQVQAVSNANTMSALSSSVSVTQPNSTAPTPTFTVDTGGATDLNDYMNNMVVPFLKIWYSKVADTIAYPGYTPYTNIKLVLNATNPSILDTHLDTGTITANTGFIRDNMTSPDKSLAAWLHESTHSIQGQASSAGNDGMTMVIEGGADYSREFIMHDRDPVKPTAGLYYNDGYSPSSYFINYIQQQYDSSYLRKITAAAHNNASTAALVTFANGTKNLDEVWAEMMGVPSHTGPFKNQGGTNMCIDDQNSVVKSGNPLQIFTCNGGNQQKVTAQLHSDGTASLYILGRCVDINNSGTADGTVVWLYNCNDGPAQKWNVRSDGTIVNPNSGKCLAVISGSAGVTAGKGLGIYTCTGASWQKWTVPTGTPTK